MQQKNLRIPILVEKSYLKSIWCKEILQGIGKQKYTLISFDELEGFSENHAIVIIGSTNHFFKKAIYECRKRSLRSVLVGAEFADFDSRISSIKTNRKAAIASLVQYCNYYGRKKTALFGISKYSSMDLEKRDAFIEASDNIGISDARKNIFYSEGSVSYTHLTLPTIA